METIKHMARNCNKAAHFVASVVSRDGTVLGRGFAESAAVAVHFAHVDAGAPLSREERAASDLRWAFVPAASAVPARASMWLKDATYEEARSLLG